MCAYHLPFLLFHPTFLQLPPPCLNYNLPIPTSPSLIRPVLLTADADLHRHAVSSSSTPCDLFHRPPSSLSSSFLLPLLPPLPISSLQQLGTPPRMSLPPSPPLSAGLVVHYLLVSLTIGVFLYFVKLCLLPARGPSYVAQSSAVDQSPVCSSWEAKDQFLLVRSSLRHPPIQLLFGHARPARSRHSTVSQHARHPKTCSFLSSPPLAYQGYWSRSRPALDGLPAITSSRWTFVSLDTAQGPADKSQVVDGQGARLRHGTPARVAGRAERCRRRWEAFLPFEERVVHVKSKRVGRRQNIYVSFTS